MPPNNGMKPTAGMGALDLLEEQPVSPGADYAGRWVDIMKIVGGLTQRGPWACVSLVFILTGGAVSAAGTGDLSHFLGTWHGTSTCVNRQVAPACKDETVVYEVRRSDRPQTAILKADKIVDGKRLPMGELEFVYSEKEGCWRAEFTTPRVQGVWCLVVDESSMTGGLRVLPENAEVRKVQLKHE